MQDRPEAAELLNNCAILAREWVADGPRAPHRSEQRELARAIRVRGGRRAMG